MSTDDCWKPGPERPHLSVGECHIWRVPLVGTESAVALWRTLLNAEEHTQADRFYFPQHRVRYAIAQGALRTILSRYAALTPEAITFFRNKHGKPFLPDRNVEFNLSHSHELALIGIVEQCAIGIDLEWIRTNSDFTAIAKRFFSEGEYEAIEALPEPMRLEAFFHCWTRKEAWIKALGVGLSFPLDAFQVSVHPSDEVVSLIEVGKPETSERWLLRKIELQEGYVGALAVGARELRLQYYDLRFPFAE